MAPRVTVVGLDAATFDVIDPLLEAGQLPNLRRIFERGSRGPLHSTIPPITSQAWATAFTGVNAGKHGLWEFTERHGSGYRLRLVNGSFRRAPAVWDYVGAAGRAVGVVNVPFTWPAQQVNGFMLAGLDAADREQGMAYPAELLEELRARYGKLEFDHRAPIDGEGNIDMERVKRGIHQKLESALWLAERFEPELLVVVFMAADHTMHYGWLDWEERGVDSDLAEVYRLLDEAAGALADAAGPEGDVVVLSDHGSGGMRGALNLNAWLAREGFLGYASRSGVSDGELARRALFKLLKQRGRLPKSLRNLVKQRAPQLRDRMHELKEFTVIDWPRTKAFAYGHAGSIVLNVRGREEHGVVEPGVEYDSVCAEISERALELRAPEGGEQLIKAVHRRDELFHGPQIEKVPDLIVQFNDYAWAGIGNLREETPSIWDTLAPSGIPLVGSHREEGILALAGPSARAGVGLQAGLPDIASTILYLLGEPVPLEFEGRVLEEALQETLLDERPPAYREAGDIELQEAQTYSADEAANVEERLRSLGYIE